MRNLDELLSELQIALDEKKPFENVKPKMKTGEFTKTLMSLTEMELSSFEKLVYLTISDCETIHVRDIRIITGVSKPTMQKNLISLMAKGLILKIQNGIYRTNKNFF